MGNNELPDSRFLFSDMFSFSFEPEILTFLWNTCAKKADDIQREYRYLFPSSSLLQVFVPFDGHDRAGFFTFLKSTVVTGGTLVFVGFSSYGAFKLLQKIRHEGFAVKNSLRRLKTSWKAPTRMKTSQSMELVLRASTTTNSIIDIHPPPDSDMVKRPSDLVLNTFGHSNGSSGNVQPTHRLNGNQLFSVSPINGDIASGDEDVAEVQGHYFGPVNPEVVVVMDDEMPSNRSLDSFVTLLAQSQDDENCRKHELPCLPPSPAHPDPHPPGGS